MCLTGEKSPSIQIFLESKLMGLNAERYKLSAEVVSSLTGFSKIDKDLLHAQDYSIIQVGRNI